MIIDTHCHLDFPQFDPDRNEVVARAVENGVRGMILVGIDPESWTSTAKLCRGSSRFWRTAGLHPNSVVRQWNADLESALREEIERGDLVGIGETGIDLYRSKSSLDLQCQAFDVHLELAAETGLPIVIHQRDAEQEVLEVLQSHRPVSGVMHCFGGDWDFAKQCLELGLHLGIGGVATYKSAEATREALRCVPLDRLLLETDAPYLAPQSARGKRNEPSFLPEVVEVIANSKGFSATAVERATTDNAVALFGLEL